MTAISEMIVIFRGSSALKLRASSALFVRYTGGGNLLLSGLCGCGAIYGRWRQPLKCRRSRKRLRAYLKLPKYLRQNGLAVCYSQRAKARNRTRIVEIPLV